MFRKPLFYPLNYRDLVLRFQFIFIRTFSAAFNSMPKVVNKKLNNIFIEEACIIIHAAKNNKWEVHELSGLLQTHSPSPVGWFSMALQLAKPIIPFGELPFEPLTNPKKEDCVIVVFLVPQGEFLILKSGTNIIIGTYSNSHFLKFLWPWRSAIKFPR